MTEKFFVDTNVFLYAHDSAESGKRSIATGWIRRLSREGNGRVSIQVLSEFYVTLRGKMRHEISAEGAWNEVNALLDWNPQRLDGHLLLQAREIDQRYRISWWDSLIVAAAQVQECSVLLTEDLQDGMRFGNVVVQNPFSMKVREPTAIYAADLQLSLRDRRPERRLKQAA